MGTEPARREARGPIDVLSHPALARLHPTFGHPESERRLEVLLDALAWREAGSAAESDALRCHTEPYLASLRAVDRPLLLDPDTVASATSYEAAMLAAGIAMRAVDEEAFAVVRPPGHHALPDEAFGFCLLGNVAIAARYAQRKLGLPRVAIVDWDVHHGNGTQAIFWDDPSVFFASLHQWPLFPGSGGPGEGNETTVNVPLAAGSGDEDYTRAFEALVAPAVRAFEPDLVLVSAGFDAHAEDELASMRVSESGFRDLARRSAALAPRVAAVLEGGYNLETLPRLVKAALDGFGA